MDDIRERALDVGDAYQPKTKRSADQNATDRKPQVHRTRGQEAPNNNEQKHTSKPQRLVAGGETFAPPHQVLSPGIHRLGLFETVVVDRLSRRELVRLISNPDNLRSEIAALDVTIANLKSQQSTDLIPTTIPLELLRARLVAALKLTEGRLKTETKQALKRKETRFFLDVIDTFRATHGEVEDITIGKRDKARTKQFQIVGVPGGEEFVFSTKSTARAKATIRVKGKNPLLEVDVGAKINWLTPRVRKKPSIEPQVSDSSGAG